MEMSCERILVAYRRALRKLNRSETDCDCPEFQAEFSKQLSYLECQDTLERNPHIFEKMGIDTDGDLLWSLT